MVSLGYWTENQNRFITHELARSLEKMFMGGTRQTPWPLFRLRMLLKDLRREK